MKTKTKTKALAVVRPKGVALKVKRNPLQAIADIPTPENCIRYLPKIAGSKAGLPYVTDDSLRKKMDMAFGKGNWGIRVNSFSGAEMLTNCGHAVVNLDIWYMQGKNKFEGSSIGEADAEFYKDKSGRTRLSNEPFKSAQTDALKKYIGDIMGFAADVYDGKIPKNFSADSHGKISFSISDTGKVKTKAIDIEEVL